MKKLLALLLGLLMILSVTGCQKQEPAPAPEVEPSPEETPSEEVKVMSYAEYNALPTDGSAGVVIEAYVQGAQSYWEGAATLYLQDKDGAYLVYSGQISEEDYAKVVPNTDYSNNWKGMGTGVKVHVEGTKAEWSGEVEIIDAVVTVIDDGDKWVAAPVDVTNYMATDATAEYMNQLVTFTDLTIAPSKDSEGNDVPFLYNWDGSGEPGSDIYFNVEKDGLTYSFVVESYLCYDGSDVYEAAEALNIGDVVDIEAFLYWYNGAQPHTVAITVKQ